MAAKLPLPQHCRNSALADAFSSPSTGCSTCPRTNEPTPRLQVLFTQYKYPQSGSLRQGCSSEGRGVPVGWLGYQSSKCPQLNILSCLAYRLYVVWTQAVLVTTKTLTIWTDTRDLWQNRLLGLDPGLRVIPLSYFTQTEVLSTHFDRPPIYLRQP